MAALNGLIVFVNAWHRIRMLRTKEFFEILEVSADSDYLRYSLEFHRAEIEPIWRSGLLNLPRISLPFLSCAMGCLLEFFSPARNREERCAWSWIS